MRHLLQKCFDWRVLVALAAGVVLLVLLVLAERGLGRLAALTGVGGALAVVLCLLPCAIPLLWLRRKFRGTGQPN